MEKAVTRNPATGAVLAEYQRHDAEARRRILDLARAAQRDWARRPLEARLAHVGRLGEILRARCQDLGALATAEMGKPLAQAVKEAEKSATACDYYRERAPAILADEPIAAGKNAKSYVAFRPLGTVLCIMPWNFPYWQVVRFAVPALAAGNAVILKHADNTTGCAYATLAAMAEAGFPPGLFQVLVSGHAELERVIADDVISAVSLTGSERAGAAVAAQAGRSLKKVVLELGGSDPYVVLADADVEAAAGICVDARLVNNGQSCVAAKRFIVESKVYDAFRDAFVAKARAKKIGDPAHTDTDVGPLAKADVRDGVAKQVERTLASGARVVLGGPGAAVPPAGFYYPVTVLDGVTPGMAAFDEEVFGPAAALIRAKDEAEAIALANRSRFGLGGAIFSRDEARAERLARDELEAGFAVVNGQVVSDPRLPFGGVKFSGYGRELAAFGMREFVNVKTVVVNRSSY